MKTKCHLWLSTLVVIVSFYDAEGRIRKPKQRTVRQLPSTSTSRITPRNTQRCTDNPRDYAVNVDIQMQFPDNEFAACDNVEQESIARRIQDSLNKNFAISVPDWEGDAYFGEFVFDFGQEVLNADYVGPCSERNVECTADSCRWGCLTSSTTDCGTSTLTNWAQLAEDVRKHLEGLGLDCLGIPDQLEVNIVVVDPDLGSSMLPTTPAPIPPGAAPSPTVDNPAATPSPSISTTTSVSTGATPSPTMAPTVLRGTTLAPAATASPSNTFTCNDNPQDYSVNIDLQIHFSDGQAVLCGNAQQDSAINSNIQAVLNENFATTVPDWAGDAFFGAFMFDTDQEVNNVGSNSRRNLGNNTGSASRHLQQGTCRARNVECDGDFCHWGCLTASTTDCGTSSLTNWVLLAEEIHERLVGLGFDCLGISQKLEVLIVVEAQETTSTLAPTVSAATPAPTAPAATPVPSEVASTPSPTTPPTGKPTSTPTDDPTPSPSGSPTEAPSSGPSETPTGHPSGYPSAAPTTSMPTSSPTATGSASFTIVPGATPSPTAPGATISPTNTLSCPDNPQDYPVNIDLQIHFSDGQALSCDNAQRDSAINSNIQGALNENFATTVPDWAGDAFFGALVFDPDQEVNTADPSARRNLIGTHRRNLHQQGACSARDVECNGNICRWGCATASTTDCGTSSLANWALLAEDIRVRLAGLGLACLGIPDQLEVILLVKDPIVRDTTRAGSLGVTDNHQDNTSSHNHLVSNDILNESEGGQGHVDDRPTRTIHVDSRLKIRFYDGHAKEPSEADISGLVGEIQAFFSDRIRKDTDFANDFDHFEVADLTYKDHHSDSSDPHKADLVIDFFGNIKVAESSERTVAEACKALTEYDFRRFIRDYVWQSPPYQENQFYQTAWFKFVTKGGY